MNKRAMRVMPLVGLGAVAAALSGCGGASTNGGQGVATPDSGPVIYGINALAVSNGATDEGETSGLSFTATTGTTSATEGALIGVTSYKTVSGAGPLTVYKSTFPNGVASNGVVSDPGVPLGFSLGGTYYNSSAATAAIPTNYTGTLVFGAYISTGVQNGKAVDLNTSSVVLTSSESSSFSQPLTFDKNFGSGVLAQAQYKTAAFPIPAFLQTTGLHDLHTTISDVGNPVQSSTTDFAVATVAPSDVALFLQSITAPVAATATAAATTKTTAITPGDTVTIDGGKGIGVYPTGYTPEIADGQGTVVLFTTPGTHTLTETDTTGKLVQTETFTLTTDTAGTTILTPPTPDGSVASIQSRTFHPTAKRAVRH